ncbi:MAG TPA: hypothetical protein VN493_31220 [Thermoanaerobaculia bacterium]|nr:hypothetical protein [Thermoanaerobaculia bacterium]
MLKLLASMPQDGWAFVGKGEETLLVRPPYQRRTLRPVPAEAVEKAVQHHGFVAQEAVFPDWASLVAHLEERYLAARREKGSEIPDVEEVRSLLHLAPSYILADYLDRVESELLPREWKAVQELMTYLLGVQTVKDDPGLYERTLYLLSEAQAARESEEERVAVLAVPRTEEDLLRKFPHTARAYGAEEVRRLARAVSLRHQVFAAA